MGRGTLPVSSLGGPDEGGRRGFRRNQEQREMARGLTDEMSRLQILSLPLVELCDLGRIDTFLRAAQASNISQGREVVTLT